MQSILFKHRDPRSKSWDAVIRSLESRGHHVYAHHPPVADISVVLSGQYENPACVSGRRILIAHADEWMPKVWGWKDFYGPLCRQWYDEVVEVTTLGLDATVETIERCLNREN